MRIDLNDTAKNHPKYRPDIDGLRAIAVLVVVGFHAFPHWVKGGFVGVDVFFVISGFLISSILYQSLENEAFSIADFYTRRVKRIFPALTLVLALSFAFGWAVLLPNEFQQLSKHVAGGSGFVANIMLWLEAGYFDNSAETKPLLHLWSLGIEEQFYIIWPLILWMLWRRHIGFLLAAASLLLVSFVLNVLLVGQDPVSTFYLPFTRFWELMFGAALAYLALHQRLGRATTEDSEDQPVSWLAHVISVLGLGLIVYPVAALDPTSTFPGWWALLPVSGACCLIAVGHRAVVNKYLLSNRIAVWFGLISYPLYLWHWPLLVYARIIKGDVPSNGIRMALVVLAIVLSWLTYRFIEKPIRTKIAAPRAVILLCSFAAVLFVLGVLSFLFVKETRLKVNGAEKYVEALGDWDFPSRGFTSFGYQGATFHRIGRPNRDTTLFIGDSYVQQYGPLVDHLLTESPTAYHSVIFATHGACPPMPLVRYEPESSHPKCRPAMEAAWQLAHAPEVKTVVLGASWIFYFADVQKSLVYNDGAQTLSFPNEAAQAASYAALGKAMTQLRAQGKEVVLLLTPPTDEAFNPYSMFRGSRLKEIFPSHDIPPFDARKFREITAKIRGNLLRQVELSGARYVDPLDTLCPNDQCPVLDETGRPLYKDMSHLRPYHVIRDVTYIEPLLRAVPSKKLP